MAKVIGLPVSRATALDIREKNGSCASEGVAPVTEPISLLGEAVIALS